MLQVNGTNDVMVNASGIFFFKNPFTKNDVYTVTVAVQPSAPTQTCTVEHGSGTIIDSDVSDVVVTCVTKRYAIGGTVVGLVGLGLTLRNNNADALSITKNGAFSFPITFPPNAGFEVSVFHQPVGPDQTCVVSGGSGTVGNSDISSVVINCQSGTFTVGGTVTGLNGSVTLRNNGSDTLTLTSNGTFAFGVPIASSQPYSVEIVTQPGPNQSCAVDQGTGVVGTSNVTSVVVRCTTANHFVGGTVVGLGSVSPVVLLNNGGDDLSVSANGIFRFAKPLASGTTYTVTVGTQPAMQDCVVARASGTVDAVDITSVEVNCTDNYPLSVQVLGVKSPVTFENMGDTLVASTSGLFTFKDRLLTNDPYQVTVKTQPSDGATWCTVNAPASGVMKPSGVTVQARCGPLGLSCDDLLTHNPGLPDGPYFIDPDGSGPDAPFLVTCDMTRDNGGWMLVTPDFVLREVVATTTETLVDVGSNGGFRQAVRPVSTVPVDCAGTKWFASFYIDNVIDWTQVRSTWEFDGYMTCWSIFGNTAQMNGEPLNIVPWSFAGGDVIQAQTGMGGASGNNFDGTTTLCQDVDLNFWGRLGGHTYRTARVIMHRGTDLVTPSGLGAGASCVPTGYAAGNWRISDVWIR